MEGGKVGGREEGKGGMDEGKGQSSQDYPTCTKEKEVCCARIIVTAVTLFLVQCCKVN